MLVIKHMLDYWIVYSNLTYNSINDNIERLGLLSFNHPMTYQTITQLTKKCVNVINYTNYYHNHNV